MTNADQIKELSPTLVASIRQCGLAVYLSRFGNRFGGAATSNPPARLGAAVHRVLAWVSEGGLSDMGQSEIEVAIRQRWMDELAREQRIVSASAVESYFGPATSWPGFATAEERLVVEASWFAAEVREQMSTTRWAEREFTASSPHMRGTPDLILADGDSARVVEFKSGTVTAEDAQPSGRYGLQVLLYAWMVIEGGFKIDSCEIRPIGRPRFAVEVSERSIREARETATETLNSFNSAVDTGDVIHIANPNDRSCTYCPHVLRCPALWDANGMRELDDMHVIEGTVSRLQETRFGSIAVEVKGTTGTRAGTVIMHGLEPRKIANLRSLKLGDLIRVSGLRAARTSNALVVRPGSWVRVIQIDSYIK